MSNVMQSNASRVEREEKMEQLIFLLSFFLPLLKFQFLSKGDICLEAAAAPLSIHHVTFLCVKLNSIFRVKELLSLDEKG